MMKINLDDVIEQLEIANESNKSFYNKKTEEIYLIPEEVSLYINSEVFEEDDLPDWEKEIIPIAKDIIKNPENYIPFPDKFYIDEYSIMESYSLSIEDNKLRDTIYNSLRGRGAFGRFKDNIHKFGIQDEWYKYRDEAMKKLAIEWCEDNNLEYY